MDLENSDLLFWPKTWWMDRRHPVDPVEPMREIGDMESTVRYVRLI